eukprot:m.27080 g.27080  ORF g.27080 m.27080 type:complete len:111 (-) comp11748_c0_seq2:59-391(-)
MNGLLAVYKPRGMLSNTVVQRCKRILQQGLKKINPSTNSWRKLKVGHGGTLDKGAEGVLVLGLGRGTKLLEAQLQGSKRYKVIPLLTYQTTERTRQSFFVSTVIGWYSFL